MTTKVITGFWTELYIGGENYLKDIIEIIEKIEIWTTD